MDTRSDIVAQLGGLITAVFATLLLVAYLTDARLEIVALARTGFGIFLLLTCGRLSINRVCRLIEQRYSDAYSAGYVDGSAGRPPAVSGQRALHSVN